MLYVENSKLVFRFDDQKTWIEPWSDNAFRIRSTKLKDMPLEDWALLPKPYSGKWHVELHENEKQASITNGKIRATISHRGKIVIYNSKGERLLEEYARHRLDLTDPKCSALGVEARELKPILGGDYHLTMRLESVQSNGNCMAWANINIHTSISKALI